MAEQISVVYHHFVAALGSSRRLYRMIDRLYVDLYRLNELATIIASEECALKVSKTSIVLSIALRHLGLGARWIIITTLCIY